MATPPQGKSRLQLRASQIEAIKTTAIVTRLNKQALGEVEMTSQSLQAAQILLRKTLPDLKVAEHTVDAHMTIELVDYGEGDAGPNTE